MGQPIEGSNPSLSATSFVWSTPAPPFSAQACPGPLNRGCYDSAAVLGGELAAPCTCNRLQQGWTHSLGLCPRRPPRQVTLRAGSSASVARQPCQIRKEAALSDDCRVPRKGLV